MTVPCKDTIKDHCVKVDTANNLVQVTRARFERPVIYMYLNKRCVLCKGTHPWVWKDSHTFNGIEMFTLQYMLNWLELSVDADMMTY